MRATRWVPVLAVLCALGGLSACSGDDEGDKSPDPTSSSPTKPGGGDPAEQKNRTCKVEVTVTGAVEASWTGKGASRTAGSGPKATYTAQDGKSQISVYSDGEDFTANANFTSGEQTFTTAAGDSTGLDIKRSGKGAEVDADAAGVEPGSTVHLTASFDC